MCVLCMCININASSCLEGLTRCELPKNSLEGTRRKQQTAQVVSQTEKIRNKNLQGHCYIGGWTVHSVTVLQSGLY